MTLIKVILGQELGSPVRRELAREVSTWEELAETTFVFVRLLILGKVARLFSGGSVEGPFSTERGSREKLPQQVPAEESLLVLHCFILRL